MNPPKTEKPHTNESIIPTNVDSPDSNSSAVADSNGISKSESTECEKKITFDSQSTGDRIKSIAEIMVKKRKACAVEKSLDNSSNDSMTTPKATKQRKKVAETTLVPDAIQKHNTNEDG